MSSAFVRGVMRLLQFVWMQREAVRRARRHLHVHAAREHDVRQIRDVTGIRAQHFVARVDDRRQRDVERLADAGRDDDLRARVVVHAVQPVEVPRDGMPQLDEPVVGGVVRLAILDAANRGLANLVRRHEVRLPDAQRDHALHARKQVEEPPDPG